MLLSGQHIASISGMSGVEKMVQLYNMSHPRGGREKSQDLFHHFVLAFKIAGDGLSVCADSFQHISYSFFFFFPPFIPFFLSSNCVLFQFSCVTGFIFFV